MLFILSQDILMLENIFWVCSYLSKKNKCYKSFSIFKNYMTKIYSLILNLFSFVSFHNLKNFYPNYHYNPYIGLLLYFMSQTVSNTNRNNRKAKCHFIIFQFLVSCHALLPILKLFYKLFMLLYTFYPKHNFLYTQEMQQNQILSLSSFTKDYFLYQLIHITNTLWN